MDQHLLELGQLVLRYALQHGRRELREQLLQYRVDEDGKLRLADLVVEGLVADGLPSEGVEGPQDVGQPRGGSGAQGGDGSHQERHRGDLATPPKKAASACGLLDGRFAENLYQFSSNRLGLCRGNVFIGHREPPRVRLRKRMRTRGPVPFATILNG